MVRYRTFRQQLSSSELARALAPPARRPCGCGRKCGRFLEPRVDKERPRLGGQEVNPDCYYEVFGDEIDSHPTGSPAHSYRR